MIKKIRDRINRVDLRNFRFWLQLFFFILFVYGGYAAINLGESIPTFACGFNNEGQGATCYFIPLQHQLARSPSSLFSMAGIAVLVGFLYFVLWFLVLNKGWCGYACPLGTIQDWISALRSKMGIPYSTYTWDQFRKLKKIKYILLVLMIFIPMGIGAGWFSHDMTTPFCMICPGRTIIPIFAGDFSQLTIDFSSITKMILTTLGMLITGLFLAGAFVKKRFFCFFCPMSALHFMLSKLAFLKLKKDGSKCTKCGDCYTVCDMQIKEIADDVESRNILQDDCIMCFKCVAACPEEGALQVDFLGQPIFEATVEGYIKRMEKGNKNG
ncbi:MAG: 4Fe-4S binding protein [Campylobacterota bacterium]|nr:4Fe-4S binding protein [Campylobacterota bacterium]